uniref:Uncharacterized protein n=1 Tax=Meloidogyne incognita TaxID=6306 RepID=A0A914MDL8_MELIC
MCAFWIIVGRLGQLDRRLHWLYTPTRMHYWINALPQAGHSNRNQHPAIQQQQGGILNTHRELNPTLQWQQGTTVNAQHEQHPALQQQQGRVVNDHQYMQNLGSTQGQDNSGIGSKSLNQQSVLNTTAHQYGDYLTQLRGQNPQYFQQTHNQNLNHQNVQHAPVSINHLSNHQPANQQSNLDNYIRSLGDIILKSDPYFMNLWCKSVQYNDLYNEWYPYQLHIHNQPSEKYITKNEKYFSITQVNGRLRFVA